MHFADVQPFFMRAVCSAYIGQICNDAELVELADVSYPAWLSLLPR
jgi:hypothetical protein